ncbi:16S rRNA (guanine(966)-N(2))-methyltransferase RsmD [Alicyclobacillus fastidiosus]|uniref:16S rRNA (Guanine(966)-N(2))-methyltransferase RsmD n=1 Tax=Alicyclobacillus fastidiosus TaxID=392011 RepID=A0ABV5AGY8_9BACL|nr:16S rRNA (guanine(966)-N(2))-methyltransferase RsmD [Alicyclobacillus fastidiosus]WEH08067.1 16S rRNA (guanine(966)-N(2))-methyltransferase RsmD [Alicyclobacillus fastidiosus]
MRVIAGEWKGHALQAPKGRDTRPTTDRVKESMFNLLPHRLDGVVVDLFAGSGALGIEALSRGASKAVFVDADRRAAGVVRENLTKLHAGDRGVVWIADWRKAVSRLADECREVDWVFLDPPYAQGLWSQVVAALADCVRVHGGIVCETPKQHLLPTDMSGFVQVKYKVYGDIAVSIYEPAVEEL